MITENDLREALLVEAEDSPDVRDLRAGIVTSGRHHSQMTRPALVALSAAAAVIVVLCLTALLARSYGGRGAPAAPGTPAAVSHSTGLELAYSFSLKPVTGYSVVSRDIVTNRDSVIYGRVAGNTTQSVTTSEVARVDVYAAGQFEPAAARLGVPVTMNGKPGYFGTLRVQLHDGVAASIAYVPALAWEYAPNAWAVSTGMDTARQTQAAELGFARSIVPGRSALLLPAKMALVPAGLVRSSVHVDTDAVNEVTIVFRLASAPASTDATYAITMTVNSRQLASRWASAPANSAAQPNPASTVPTPQKTISSDGVLYVVSRLRDGGGTSLFINSADQRLSVNLGWTDALSKTTNLDWTALVRAPSLDDPSTWFDATVAIP